MRAAGCLMLKYHKTEDILKRLNMGLIFHIDFQLKENVDRIDLTRWPRQILAYVPKGRRNLGRSGNCWHETITHSL